MKDLCRALDAEAAQARQAAWRARLSVRRLEDPPEKVPTQRTFAFMARDWVGATRRQTYLRTRLNELSTAMVRYTLTSQRREREVFPLKSCYEPCIDYPPV